MGKKTVKDDAGELEMLLNEIPLATSNNLIHHYRHAGDDEHDHDHGHGVMGYDVDYDDTFAQIKYRCASSSPVSGLSLQSDGSSSSFFSVVGSPTPPPLEDLTSTMPCPNPNTIWLDSKAPDSAVAMRKKGSDIDELGLCANLSKMYIGNQQENPNGLAFPDYYSLSGGNNSVNVHGEHGDRYDFRRGLLRFQWPVSDGSHCAAETKTALLGLNQDCNIANLFGSQQCPRWHGNMIPQSNGSHGSMGSPRHVRQMRNGNCGRGSMEAELAASLSRNPMVDDLFYARNYGTNIMEERGMPRAPDSPLCTNLSPYRSVSGSLHYNPPMSNVRAVPLTNARLAHGSLDTIISEGSFIIQGEGSNYVASRGLNRSRCQGAVRESNFTKHLQRSELEIQCHGLGTYETPRSHGIHGPFSLESKYNSLAEVRGYIYLIAKDQHGCRFLQRVFEEGLAEDVQVIFNEIVDHVAELMMNSFGNYLMQKLLDVCNEEQRMQIILKVTMEPGQLVRISLNTHGTRVVQKLIETLKTRRQISLVVSALEPGFLALIKDLNGNHVVQHCLQFLSNEDNKFIFVAAAKYCVDIATHQHGCCVLQRCIGHSNGEHREKLIAEISANALLLAQHQYGNYVVQFILDLRTPSATSTMNMQFEGNYVYMSMQKFSSHVVEKCLAVFNDENRARIICELLCAPCFEQLLQDPHANYVIQSALRYSEGYVHNLLVEAVESYKAISRNSPYSKKIFSQKLLKK
ncbi:mRNA-binding protein puf3-like [Arachis stenosperma]|uniref:mRNA-binding protein puf3-like n=1 Tax=Arachis stenosperma TaxID=217475 RepID=UPI0025AB91D1|nr:mRNA-binding protein puf3-like [Arachis stenosperma]